MVRSVRGFSVAYNISANGLKVGISGAANIQIDDFADDAEPLSIQPIEVSDHKFDVNGEIVHFSKCTGYVITVSVVPGSEFDKALIKLSLSSRFDGASSYDGKELTMTITQRHLGQIIFTKGRMQTGNGGMSASSQGRYKGNTYTFLFGKKG